MIIHEGTADSGHYYSLAKDRYSANEDAWVKLNDESVTEFDVNEIASECFGGMRTLKGGRRVTTYKNAFMIFYQRVEKEKPEEESLVLGAAESVSSLAGMQLPSAVSMEVDANGMLTGSSPSKKRAAPSDSGSVSNSPVPPSSKRQKVEGGAAVDTGSSSSSSATTTAAITTTAATTRTAAAAGTVIVPSSFPVFREDSERVGWIIKNLPKPLWEEVTASNSSMFSLRVQCDDELHLHILNMLENPSSSPSNYYSAAGDKGLLVDENAIVDRYMQCKDAVLENPLPYKPHRVVEVTVDEATAEGTLIVVFKHVNTILVEVFPACQYYTR